MVTIKSKAEIEYMKTAGRVTGETLKLLEELTALVLQDTYTL